MSNKAPHVPSRSEVISGVYKEEDEKDEREAAANFEQKKSHVVTGGYARGRDNVPNEELVFTHIARPSLVPGTMNPGNSKNGITHGRSGVQAEYGRMFRCLSTPRLVVLSLLMACWHSLRHPSQITPPYLKAVS